MDSLSSRFALPVPLVPPYNPNLRRCLALRGHTGKLDLLGIFAEQYCCKAPRHGCRDEIHQSNLRIDIHF
jgi:hypothetical protein